MAVSTRKVLSSSVVCLALLATSSAYAEDVAASFSGRPAIGDPESLPKLTAKVDINLVYVGSQGGYHLGEGNSGFAIFKGKNPDSNFFGACRLTLASVENGFWIFGIDGTELKLAFQCSSKAATYEVWLWECDQWHVDWDRATRGPNSFD